MVSEPCRATWFSYQSCARETNRRVSEPCRATWFSYGSGLVSCGLTVSEPCRATWFSYLKTYVPLSTRFQSRVRLPDSFTLRHRRQPLVAFQSRVEPLGSLTCLLYRITEIGVSEPSRITWYSYGLQAGLVSEPCQIIWYSYPPRRPGRHLRVSGPCRTARFSYLSRRGAPSR